MSRSAETVTVEGPAGPMDLTVRRSPRARRLSLRLDKARGGAVLVLPPGVSLEEGVRFARGKAEWLHQQIRTLPPTVLLGAGAVVPLRDQPHRVCHDPGLSRRPVAADGAIHVGGPADLVGQRLGRWLKDQARQDLAERVRCHAAALDVSVARVTVKDTRRQWGSASVRGGLSFSWRLILAPPFVLDYLAAHEVSHLCEMNHSPRFWALVDGLTADRRPAEAWLTRNGPGLHAYRLPVAP